MTAGMRRPEQHSIRVFPDFSWSVNHSTECIGTRQYTRDCPVIVQLKSLQATPPEPGYYLVDSTYGVTSFELKKEKV